MNVIVLDDNRILGEALSSDIDSALNKMRVPHTVFSCCSTRDVREMMDGGKHVDLLVTDIDLPEENNGIKFAQFINRSAPETKIIYITAFNEYSRDISDSNFIYYLVKPICPNKLINALKKAVNECKKAQSNVLMLKTGDAVHAVLISNIVYVESLGHRIFYHLSDNTEISVREKLDLVEKRLTDYPDFLRIHKSFLVNMAHINKIVGATVVLNNGNLLTISGGKTRSIKDAFSKYLIGNMTCN
ncbi:MAG: LytTR family DNA-binding domain-containing protein [Oscillospiraceae bacterium]